MIDELNAITMVNVIFEMYYKNPEKFASKNCELFLTQELYGPGREEYKKQAKEKISLDSMLDTEKMERIEKSEVRRKLEDLKNSSMLNKKQISALIKDRAQ